MSAQLSVVWCVCGKCACVWGKRVNRKGARGGAGRRVVCVCAW